MTDCPGGQGRYWRTDGIQAGQVFEKLAWWPVMKHDPMAWQNPGTGAVGDGMEIMEAMKAVGGVCGGWVGGQAEQPKAEPSLGLRFLD